MNKKTVRDVDLKNKRVLMRVDGAYGPLAVFVNSQPAGEHLFRGKEDYAFDISSLARASMRRDCSQLNRMPRSWRPRHRSL